MIASGGQRVDTDQDFTRVSPAEALAPKTGNRTARYWFRRHVRDWGNNILKSQGMSEKIPRLLWDSTPAKRVSAQEAISQAISVGRPFCAARFGNDELTNLLRFQFQHLSAPGKLGFMLATGDPFFFLLRSRVRLEAAGMKPLNNSNLERFWALWRGALPDVDLLGSWLPGENLFSEFLPTANLSRVRELEPYRSKQPWSQSLAGKKVLIVHPFGDSILRQYHDSRPQIFNDERVLPAFEITVHCPPRGHFQEISGADHWFELYEDLVTDVLERDFDIALIGAGAFGLPLASHIKRSGRIAIHLGGATQLLFGIMGNRWNADEEIRSLLNDFWTWPTQSETPNRGARKRSPYWAN